MPRGSGSSVGFVWGCADPNRLRRVLVTLKMGQPWSHAEKAEFLLLCQEWIRWWVYRNRPDQAEKYRRLRDKYRSYRPCLDPQMTDHDAADVPRNLRTRLGHW